MRNGRLKSVLVLLALGLASFTPRLIARKKDDAASALNNERHAVHALNRLTFGPRPGDVQQVMAMGVDRWIDLQLHPEKIDDSALGARLQPFCTQNMSTQQIAENFPDGQEINQVKNGKKPLPSDPARRAVYQVQLIRLEERKERKEEAGKTAADVDPANAKATAAKTMPAASGDMMASPDAAPMAANRQPAPEDPGQAPRREQQLYDDLEVQQLPSLSPDQRYQKVMRMSPDQQLALADSLKGGKGQDFLAGLTPRQKETFIAMNNPGAVVKDELSEAKLLRAIYSQRQLQEVMTDFWFNHFNVYIDKGLAREMVTSYERDVIRPRAFGKFEDLLVATAKSPAMLFYLDNWLSVGPDSAQALGIPAHPNPYRPFPKPNKGKKPSGLNENYGRELLELHTLSVNGGYSQRDVTEVAKVFTGWTIDKPAEGGGFKFDPRMHQPGPKFVLGHRIKPRGEAEGLEVLHRLATSPQTAHFISLKLAERFVSDDPPSALVDRMTKTFLKKKGDIREVLAAMFHSPEFWDDSIYRAKVKTPLEFVASTIRATGADVQDALPLTRQLNNMGMPLYGAQPPTGYSMKAETWVSSSALLNRMNFALALTAGKIKGVTVDSAQLASNSLPSDAGLALSALETNLLAGEISKQTHDSIAAQIAGTKIELAKIEPAKIEPAKIEPAKIATAGLDGKNSIQQAPDNKSGKPGAAPRSPDVNTLAGLLLGSPEFQRR